VVRVQGSVCKNGELFDRGKCNFCQYPGILVLGAFWHRREDWKIRSYGAEFLSSGVLNKYQGIFGYRSAHKLLVGKIV